MSLIRRPEEIRAYRSSSDDVGFACAYLATPYARCITGTTMYVDGGVNVMA